MNHDYINELNLIDRYVLGKLTTSEAEAFEDHFIDCAECAEQLTIARNFIQELKGFAVHETLSKSDKTPEASRWWSFRQPVLVPSWAVACCCGLVLLAAVLAFFTVRRLNRMSAELAQKKQESATIRQQYERGLETAAASERDHQETTLQLNQRLDELAQKLKTEGEQPSVRSSQTPQVNFPIFALVSVRRGGPGSGPTEIALPVSNSEFALSIPVEDQRNFSGYRITILNEQKSVVWRQSGFRPDGYHTLSLSLKSTFLPRGTYDLRVEGQEKSGQWTTIGSYPFRYVRQGSR